MTIDVSCLILAAGLSRRFGSAKMLHPLANGKPMLAITIALYQSVFENVNVVIADGDRAIESFLQDQGVSIVKTADNSKGMSQSIISGVGATEMSQGWLIALGDMPYLQSITISQLKSSLREENIVIPRFHKRVGNPVGFGSKYKDELLALSGDMGAKLITQNESSSVCYIDTDDEGVLLDIDYPASIIC